MTRLIYLKNLSKFSLYCTFFKRLKLQKNILHKPIFANFITILQSIDTFPKINSLMSCKIDQNIVFALLMHKVLLRFETSKRQSFNNVSINALHL